MAPSKDALDESSNKIKFFCCKTKQTSAIICVQCGRVYHKSCAYRDWAEKIRFLDETRVECLEHDLTSTESKNEILCENNGLLREKVEFLEGKINKNNEAINKGHSTSAGVEEVHKPAKNLNQHQIQLSKSPKQENTNKATKENVNNIVREVQSPAVKANHATLALQPEEPFQKEANNIIEESLASNVEEGNNNWQLVTNRKQRRPKQARPEPVLGENCTFSLSVATKKGYIFISGLGVDAQLEKYMKENANVSYFGNAEVLETALSDHHAIQISINTSLNTDKEVGAWKMGRIFSKSKLQALCSELTGCVWDDVLGEADAEKAFNKLAGQLARPLAHVINLSIQQGTYPTLSHKIALVKPVFKKDNPSEPKDYRPISLLPNINKVFEKIIYTRLETYLEKHQILTELQNGFRKGRSTVRAIYQALQKIIKSMNDRKATMAIFLDLSKAFDSVDHSILLKKLEAYGIRGVALKLLESYLSNRRQCIVDRMSDGRQFKSGYKEIKKGVPQGSVLGPLLYIIYTNDVTNVYDDMVMFADDTSLICSKNTDQECANQVAQTVGLLEDWFSINNLLLNVNKTQILNFKQRPSESSLVQIGRTEIRTQQSANFLGVMMDERLDWGAHVELVAANMSRYFFALRLITQEITITEQIKTLKEELVNVELVNVDQIRQENRALKKEVEELKDKLQRVEKDSRRYKILIHGLEEGTDEVSDIRGCLELINQNLGVECRFSDLKNAARTYRGNRSFDGAYFSALSGYKAINHEHFCRIRGMSSDTKWYEVFKTVGMAS
ncbi:uncharacterized protein LOC126741310 [Anthonomus grandis grandis]|uniref:uncharacterized protein LOC126741310 n=1 Tax=Anthonomus grandis grandis TaxID=2921223 RepID=UPI0021659A1E|nr:uncharacterized protein LOC126741310 [Anthonomus grandis grandis]